VLGEYRADHVGLLNHGVDDEELLGRILVGYFTHGLLEKEAGRDDQVKLLVGEGGEVRYVVGLGG
jgi:hypothetical protein